MDNDRKELKLICYATDSSSSKKARYKFPITIATAPEPSSTNVRIDGPHILFDIYTDVMLNCSLTNDTDEMNVEWWKINHQERRHIDPNTDAEYFRNHSKVQLHIVNATDHAEGVYACKYVIANEANENGEIVLYQTFEMAVKPYWSKWSQWSRCQPKCGNSRAKRRFRICHKPKMLRSNMQWRCHGASVQRMRCSMAPCSDSRGHDDDNVWTEWSEWSGCSRTCGSGQMFRHRACVRHPCHGPNIEVIECFRAHCIENTPNKIRLLS